MKTIKSLLFIVLSVTISVSLLNQCARANDWGGEGTPKYGGVLVRPMPGDVNHLNLALDSDADEWVREIYSTLIKMDMNLNPQPDLAESWEISQDGKTYTFHLLHNATWHDGAPVTSADVKFSIEKVYPFGPANRAWLDLDSVDTPDDYTVVVEFKVSNPTLFYWLLDPVKGGCIMPKHIFEKDETLEDMLKNPATLAPVGSGPFKFKEWVRGSHITMVANPNYYYEGIPYLSQIVVRIIPDLTTTAAAFEAKELSLIDGRSVLPERFDSYAANPDIRSWSGPSPPGNAYLFVNLRSPPLDNVKVRQSIAYAINREEIRDKVFYGLSTVGKSLIPSLTFGHNLEGVTVYNYDPEKANALLDEADYPRGSDGKRFTIDILYDTRATYVKSAEIIRSNLADVGIELILKSVDRATYFALYQDWDFDTAMFFPATGADPSIHTLIFTTKNIGHVWSSNVMGYSNPSFDELHELALVEMNKTKRAEYYHEIQKLVNADCPAIYVYERPNMVAMWNDFDGTDPDGVLGMINDPDKHAWGWWTYWTKGSDISAESALKSITDAELKIQGLSAQFYDVSQSLKKIAEARSKYDPSEYATWREVQLMVIDAEALATPPYLMYAGIASGWIAAIILALAWVYRRRK